MGSRGLRTVVGLVEFTQATRFGCLRMAAPNPTQLCALCGFMAMRKICKKQGGWVFAHINLFILKLLHI